MATERSMRRLGCIALLLGASLGTGSALAADPPMDTAQAEASARALFQQGNELIDQARYLEALDAFQAAYAAWQNPKILLNIGTTLRALERRSAALAAYREYLGSADPPPERRAQVERIVQDLDGLVAHITLTLRGEVTRLTLDGTALRVSSSTELQLDPGRHVLLAETPGGPQSTELEVRAGDRREVLITAPAPPPPPVVPPPAPPPEVAQDQSPAPAASSLALGVSTRVDIDGGGAGAVGAAGLTLALGPHWRASLGGLVGAHAGGWAGLELSVLDAALTPTLGVSAPLFFVEGPRLGVSAEAGVRWAVSKDLFYLTARGALVFFPSVPAAYEKTAFIPAFGSELRL